jgi:hypothetical protein
MKEQEGSPLNSFTMDSLHVISGCERENFAGNEEHPHLHMIWPTSGMLEPAYLL